MAREMVIRSKADVGRRRHHSHHYLGFAKMLWTLFLKGEADESDGDAAATAVTK
jgi:hypothetical protein